MRRYGFRARSQDGPNDGADAPRPATREPERRTGGDPSRQDLDGSGNAFAPLAAPEQAWAAPLGVEGLAGAASAREQILWLQRTRGNQYTQGLLRGQEGSTLAPDEIDLGTADHDVDAPILIHRHSSWEHALLGDTPPSRLGAAVASPEDRAHVLAREWSRLQFFSGGASRDPRGSFADYRWIQLRASELWVTYGELNALADYLPNPEAIDSQDRTIMVPVLQRMRQTMLGSLSDFAGFPGGTMLGAAKHGMDFVPGLGAVAELKALDAATEALGPDQYSGLLARNACHFAPFSWQRWILYHEEAREHALAYNGGMCREAPIEHVDTSIDEDLRQAWLKNGYGDHFLQDSFAAGHLVNKTLVMQWFAEYLLNMPWIARPWKGVPSGSELEAMTEAEQPGIAGRGLYDIEPGEATSSEDRRTGTSATDPQSARERETREGRIGGSGVRATSEETREEAYRTYLDLLNTSYLQLAAGKTHDWFNEHGLWVSNDRGDRLRVGGDDTMLSESDPIGAEVAAEAAHRSQQAILDLLKDGATDITVDSMLELVPKYVYPDTDDPGDPIPLEEWQDTVLRDLCFRRIFPSIVTSASGDIVRTFGDTMIDAGISPDHAEMLREEAERDAEAWDDIGSAAWGGA